MNTIILCLFTVFSMACSMIPKAADATPAVGQNTTNAIAQKPIANETSKSNSTAVTTPKVAPKTADDICPAVKRDGKRQIKSQTFPFNFQPFENMCFVTFASLEDMLDAKDVPRGSTFHLYQDGESVVDLPDAFDGQSACWVEGVSFKDLNADGLTDIVIAGSCLGAKNSYPSNAVFANNGEDFTTNAEANQKLENFKKLSEIESFVKKNQGLFF